MVNSNSGGKIIVAMPAYNEEKYIGSMVLRCQQYADEVIVIDDGSGDSTAEIVKLAGATLIKHDRNRGYGATVKHIITEAKTRDTGVLVLIDADTQHNPAEIPSLIEAIRQGADVVIGSRKLAISSHIPWFRRLGQRVLLGFTNVLSRQKLTDTESGFRAFSRKALEQLELKEEGMAVSAETVSVAVARGLQITEVPISVTYSGVSSTMHPVRHGLSVLNRVLVMISERRPLLFFGLPGAIFLLGGLVIGAFVVRSAYVDQVLDEGRAMITLLLVTIGVLSLFSGLLLNVLVKRLDN